MVIKGVKTIAEYKRAQTEKIQNWIDRNFFEGSVTWKMSGPNAISVTDKTGDSMIVPLDEISIGETAMQHMTKPREREDREM